MKRIEEWADEIDECCSSRPLVEAVVKNVRDEALERAELEAFRHYQPELARAIAAIRRGETE